MLRPILIGWLLWTAAVRAVAGPYDRAAVDARSRQILHSIFDQEENWVKIHAAEALVIGGEGPQLRELFLSWMPKIDTLPYRVGIWRVLANTAPTAADREAAVRAVEQIYLNPAARDRSQAIETLNKLRCALSGPILATVRQGAADGPVLLRPLCLWSLVLSGEKGALERLCALLRSPDATMRVDAGYALRWLKTSDPQALKEVAAAAAAEPPDSKAYPYLVGAAFALHAAPARRAEWRAKLERLLENGSSDARFEACQALRPDMTPRDLPRYQKLLDSSDHDTQVGAAGTLLDVYARQ